jgi:iron complex transport system permease protein
MSIVSVLPIDILKRFIIARYVLIALLVIFAIFSLVTGPMNLSSSEGILTLFDSLLGTQYNTLEQYQQVVIMELRLPRLLLAVMVGAMLAQCGAVMQGLFRNPLADPGIVGVSSGASVGAVLAICLFPVSISVWSIPLFAFLGGLVTTLLVYRLAKSSEGTSVLMLLLAGVAISAFSGALIGFISYFADDQKLRALSLWQMGSLAGANSEYLWLSFITMLTLFWAFQRQANALNASSGMIGFIGLVIPHLVRMSLGPNHTTLLPLSALCGALLLLLSDLLARTLVQPAELPVGLITALLGAPFFLALLLQLRRKGGL